MQDIINLIIENGMFVVLLAYFIFKDYKFNDNILNVLQEVKEVMLILKEYHQEDINNGN